MAYTWTPQDAAAARADDCRHNREHPAHNKGQIKFRRCIDQRAVQEAIRSEGGQVMESAGDGYWTDMEKRYPEILADDRYRHRHAVRAGRFGMPSYTFVRGKWYRVEASGNLTLMPNGCPRIRTRAEGYVLPSHVQE